MARRKTKKRSGFSPYTLWWGLALALLGVAGVPLLLSGVPLFWTWIVTVNLAALLFYGLDKLLAVRRRGRIPELVLHSLELLGGSPAALLGQRLFNHKRRKGVYLFWYWTIVVLQGVVLLIYIRGF